MCFSPVPAVLPTPGSSPALFEQIHPKQKGGGEEGGWHGGDRFSSTSSTSLSPRNQSAGAQSVLGLQRPV